MNIAEIHNYKNGNKRVDFFHIGIYELIRNKLNFRFIKIDGQGYYLSSVNGVYEISNFYRMQDALTNYIKNEFENLEINGTIDYIDFLNSYYRKSVLTNGNSIKTYLSKNFELTENNLHKLKMKIDFQYKYEVERKRMKEFLKQEKFIKTIDQIGNFSKDADLYYKQISDKVFLAINYPNFNSEKKQPKYDLWKIRTSDKKKFLEIKNDQIEDLILGFNPEKHSDIYNAEINVC